MLTLYFIKYVYILGKIFTIFTHTHIIYIIPIYMLFFKNSYRFTVIAVDPQVTAIDGKTYDVLFIGTGILYYYNSCIITLFTFEITECFFV